MERQDCNAYLNYRRGRVHESGQIYVDGGTVTAATSGIAVNPT
jgi:hypothetical protein